MKHASVTSYLLLLFISSLLLFSCSTKKAFDQSVVVPGANGQVKVKKDGNNNYGINVSVRDLIPPARLVPSKKTYVVWSEGSAGVTSIGQLVSSRSFLKRGYTASLSGTTTDRPKRVFITAEDDANATSPGTQVVLSTSKF